VVVPKVQVPGSCPIGSGRKTRRRLSIWADLSLLIDRTARKMRGRDAVQGSGPCRFARQLRETVKRHFMVCAGLDRKEEPKS
jgi:hypothetical protein